MEKLTKGSVLEEKYQIIDCIGEGGMSIVLLAEHMELKKKYAIKQMKEIYNDQQMRREAIEQFRAEARILAGLTHANLPAVTDFFTRGDSCYLVMDYIEGTTLQRYITERRAPPTESEVLGWARQLLDTLIYLHGHKPPVILRDLKPGNVMLTPSGDLKLIDFGISKCGSASEHTSPFARGRCSEGYAALEQYESDGRTDARTDIYALGATLYFALTGTRPPVATTRALSPEALKPIHRLNPEVSEELERIIHKALEVIPDGRYRSAAQMRDEILHLQSLKRKSEASASTATTVPPVKKQAEKIELQLDEAYHIPRQGRPLREHIASRRRDPSLDDHREISPEDIRWSKRLALRDDGIIGRMNWLIAKWKNELWRFPWAPAEPPEGILKSISWLLCGDVSALRIPLIVMLCVILGAPLSGVFLFKKKDSLRSTAITSPSKITQRVEIYTGHLGGVTSVAFSPDGKLALTGSSDGTIRLWDAETGNQVRAFIGVSDKIRSVAFSPTGDLALSGGDDKTVRLWDIDTGKEIKKLTGHSGAVNCVSFSPDGGYAVSGSDDTTLRLWDIAKRSEIEVRILTGHQSRIESAAFSPDGKSLLSLSAEGNPRLWSIASGKLVRSDFEISNYGNGSG